MKKRLNLSVYLNDSHIFFLIQGKCMIITFISHEEFQLQGQESIQINVPEILIS